MKKWKEKRQQQGNNYPFKGIKCLSVKLPIKARLNERSTKLEKRKK